MSNMKDTAEDKWTSTKNNIDHKIDNVKDAVKS